VVPAKVFVPVPAKVFVQVFVQRLLPVLVQQVKGVLIFLSDFAGKVCLRGLFGRRQGHEDTPSVIVSGAGNKIKLWNVETGSLKEPKHTLEGHG